MPSTVAHSHTTTPAARPLVAAKRVGYLAAAACSAVLLWVSHQLLDWGWPAFLTDDFRQVLGLVTASLVVSIVVNLALALYDGGRFRALTELVTSAFGLLVLLRVLEVFPFDFGSYATDWSGHAHGLLILLIAVTGLAMVVNLVTLVAGPGDA